MRAVKPLRINWILPTANLSGGVNCVRLLAEAMSKRGHKVNIAFISKKKSWPALWRSRLFIKRLIKELQLFGKEEHHLQQTDLPLIAVPKKKIDASDVPDADISIATWWETMEWIKDWPASKGIKAYYIQHYEIHGGDEKRVKATYQMPSFKIVIAKWLERLMKEEFRSQKIVLVPNGVDRTQFNPSTRSKASVPTIGMLYSNEKWKGVDTAFEAIRLAQKNIPELQVISFGKHPIPSDYTVPKNFHYYLRPSQKKIPKLYAKTDCWLVASTSEGFGMPGLEAAACRCPIISTRCGGPEDYVIDGVTGYLVDVGSADQMANRIIDIVNLSEQKWKTMSESSYAKAKMFNWDKSAEILEKTILAEINVRQSEV